MTNDVTSIGWTCVGYGCFGFDPLAVDVQLMLLTHLTVLVALLAIIAGLLDARSQIAFSRAHTKGMGTGNTSKKQSRRTRQGYTCRVS